MGLHAERPREDRDGEHRRVVRDDGPHGEHEDEPPHHGQVRVPRLREDRCAVGTDEQRRHRGHCEHEPEPAPPERDPQRDADGEDVERRGRRLEGPRVRAEQLRVAAHRLGMIVWPSFSRSSP